MCSSDLPVSAKRVYKKAFEELFPGEQVPEAIGVACCSQFAVRREAIRMRPRADYIRYRNWLMETELEDSLSGRVLEYSWHSEFTLRRINMLLEMKLTCNSNIWQKIRALPQRWRVLLQNVRTMRFKLR